MRQLIQNIKNILYWIPKLWNNYNFDSHYLLELIVHKLKLMYPVFKNGYCEGCDERAETIRDLIWLGEKILKDNYFDNDFYETLSNKEKRIYFDKLDIRENRDVKDFFNILGREFRGLWDQK